MLLLVGLGNPGPKYAANRHNIGFQLIDLIAAHYGFAPARQKFHGLLQEGYLDLPPLSPPPLYPPPEAATGARERTLLLKPQTFYNEAGKSVAAAVRFHKIPSGSIVVIHDDIDLAPGKIRIKRGGGNAGNNGLKSISSFLGPDFRRLRIGIGHPGDKDRVTGHVLGDFSRQDATGWRDLTLEAVIRACPYLGLDDTKADAKFMSHAAAHVNPQHTPQTTRPAAEQANTAGTDPTPAPPAKSSSHLDAASSRTALADRLTSLFKAGNTGSSSPSPRSHKDTE